MKPDSRAGKPYFTCFFKVFHPIISVSYKATWSGVPTGTFVRKSHVDVNGLLASRSLKTSESSPK